MRSRMLLTMAKSYDLKVMGGDVGNAFTHAPSLEKVHSVAGEEFGELKGCVVEIIQSLCGMAPASRVFSLNLGYFIDYWDMFRHDLIWTHR